MVSAIAASLVPGSSQRSKASIKSSWLATRKGIPVKILARGELTKPLTVHAHAFSGAARTQIEAAGGTCRLIEGT